MRIFVDTSYLFKWLYWFKKFNGYLPFLENIFSGYNIFLISSFVLWELERNLLIKKIVWSDKEAKQLIEQFFLKYKDIKVYKSQIIDDKRRNYFLSFVNDINNVQIIIDVLNTQSNILLTDNIKDFKVSSIKK